MGFDSGSSSSEEIGHDQAEESKVVGENAVPASRFYECTYCKRGFTNAQALGGHMNIHRKEKAQAKQQKSANKRQPRKCDEDLANCSTSTAAHPRYYEHHDQHQIQNYEVPGDHQQMNGNYGYQQHYFFPAPGSNPRPRHDHGDLVRANEDRGEESEVDLELRLGLTL